jgi:hypothetical protein
MAGCHDGGGDVDAFCRAVGQVPQVASLAAAAPAEAVALSQAFLGTVTALDDLEADAPSAIRGDVHTLADTAAAVGRALARTDDPAPPAARLQPLRDDLTEARTASDHVVAYTQEHCGINLAGPG